MKDVLIFLVEVFAVCFCICALAIGYMAYKAEPFPYDDEDW